MNYTSEEIQAVSSEFRNVARRLSRTDYAQCDANLKRFMSTITSNGIIEDFIVQKNTQKYDVEGIITARDWLNPFEISPNVCEEISLEYQLLKFALDKFDGDFTRLYGTYYYTSAKSTVNDEMNKFIEHIIDPLIDHIGEHLRICYNKAIREEEKTRPSIHNGITANYSTVVVGSSVNGNVSTQVNINENTMMRATELIDEINESVQKSDLNDKEDITDILKQIEEDLRSNIVPKKGFFISLKTLCVASAPIISLITALIKLFFS